MGHFDRVIELRDPLHGPIAVSSAELRVIDAPHVQRLRRIKQLGFAEHVFPGAVHNRFLHSVGTMHLAGRVASRALRDAEWLSPTARERMVQLARLAALLHDIGHAPLSHAAESLLPARSELAVPGEPIGEGHASHEDVSRKLILDSGLTAIIDDAFRPMGITARHIAAVLEADRPADPEVFAPGGVDHRPLLHAMVSGELDVDRMDYLLRDSYFTGVGYGRYDIDWIVSNITALADGGAVVLALNARAIPAFEHFLLARYHMFQMVYYHPKSDVFDAMLRQWLKTDPNATRFPADPEAYGRCDDAWLFARLAASDNPWAQRVLNLDPYRLVVELREEGATAQMDLVEAALTDANLAPLRLTARPILSKYAMTPAEDRVAPLWVVSGNRRRPIEEATHLFERYTRPLHIERLYTDRADRAQAKAIIDALDLNLPFG